MYSPRPSHLFATNTSPPIISLFGSHHCNLQIAMASLPPLPLWLSSVGTSYISSKLNPAGSNTFL